ncbi:thiazole tautomerase TenI [Evansella sp. LMS18]|uniref:thiazole tautomerase TenI n=1 Tax=Evansella sp. LMS18 TaxID=2924033 RepID=UPI0020D12AB5|nr:thiazole tautomerase TenI [Evansella sp. LMS18]UTR09897.1 thiazole tautomerase TenI [Evansella sp. LMS18]
MAGSFREIPLNEVESGAQGLHVISTGRQSAEELSAICGEIHPYLTAVHIREKQRTAIEIYQLISLLVQQGVPKGKIIVNDRVDAAAAAKVKGVQLAYHSLGPSIVKKVFPDLLAGRSVHSLEEAVDAEKEGSDYLLFGHVFSTKSKVGVQPRGTERLKEITEKTRLPVIAIGGITPENTKQVIETGAAGIAVMSGILEAADPVGAARRYREQLERTSGGDRA